MAKRMLIDALHTEETRVVIADDNQIFDFDFASSSKKQLKGNIYLAKITRVEPSLQAAFVEYGGGKQGFLPFSEIHTDYYQIPISDRQRLMAEAEREAEMDDDSQQDYAPSTTEGADAGNELSSSDIDSSAQGEQETSLDQDQSSDNATLEGASHPAYLMQGAIDVSISSADIPEESASSETIETAIEETQDLQAIIDIQPEAPIAEGEALAATAPEGEKTEEVETLPNDEEELQNTRKRRNVFMKRYKIQEVIRRGQIVLVQVIKEERGNKGCSLTTYLSLAGRYCVLMPNSPKDGGISRKIASAEDRKRLKAISAEMRLADGMSVIIRTAGMERTRAEIKRDYDYLVKLWNQIREDTLGSVAPALIYEESDIIKRAIRDQYSNDIDEVIIEGDEGYRTARDFMKMLLPSHTPKIKHYKDSTPLFYAYGNIEEQLLSMHDPVVKLRSGGYIVINPTEALISIDVNSGRATTERNIEETASKTNLEAAIEVARQLRLRDLAGLIVIDFIDMLESRHRRAVEKALKDALKADRAKIQLGRISPFGLLEMSRQRLRPSISESNMVQCAHCAGRGFVRSNESMSIQMIRSISKEASTGTWSGLRLIAPQAVALHLLNTKRDALRAMEERYNFTLQVLINNDLPASEFNLEKMRRSQSERSNEASASNNNNERRNNRRDRDRDRDRNDRGDRNRQQHQQPQELAASDDAAEDTGDNIVEVVDPQRDDTFSPEGGRRRNRRGRRGGRNRSDRQRPQDGAPRNNDADAPDHVDAEGEYATSEGNQDANGNAPENDGQQQEGRQGRRGRGGRGRRRWRDERGERGERQSADGDNNAPQGDGEGNDQQSRPEQRQHRPQPDNVLPAFAMQDPIQPEQPRSEPQEQPKAIAVGDSAPRDPNAPTKKGWWQKMIELDE